LLQGQSIFIEDFSDGNFTQNPSWQGDTGLFLINANTSLQLNDTAAGTAYLSTPSNLIDSTTWAFSFEFDFNPSSSNFARFYLVSDQSNLSGGLNGYYVRLGGSSADRVSVYQQTGASSTLVCESPDDWLDFDPAAAQIEVQRSRNGFWRLAIDTGQGLVPVDSALENTHSFSTHLGWYCQYTTTRATRIYLDSLRVQGFAKVDTTAPILDSLLVLSNNQVRLYFSELLSLATAEDEANYTVDGGLGNPALAVQDAQDARAVTLSFLQNFINKQAYQISTSGLADRFGNFRNNTGNFRWVVAQEGDLVFNEIMADPVPVIGNPPNALPEREYLELLNRSTVPINLRNFVLQAGNSTVILPPYELAPQALVVLTKNENQNEFATNLPVLGIDISSVALTNSGATLTLTSPQGQVVSSLIYSPAWYADANKTEGGWSLEQIDPNNLCGGAQNWRASISAIGGTPGLRNSVLGENPDTVAPQIQRLALPGDSSILLLFNERLAEGFLDQKALYQISPSLIIDSLEIPPTRDRVLLRLSQALAPETIYQLWLNTLPQDCSGNTMQADTLTFGLPAVPQKGELLINELLFNPYPNGSDFVEIYNNSNLIFDLAKLRLGNWNATTGLPENLTELSSESFLIYPQQYLALTENVAGVTNFYQLKTPSNLAEVLGLPSLSDAEGSLCLTTSNFTMLDSLVYDESWHLPVLDNQEGVSLERLDFFAATQNANNWGSAAASAGYATPGAANSQQRAVGSSVKLSLSPTVFSPNQDGYHDFLTINYDFPQGGQVIKVQIFNPRGQRITTLTQNQNTGNSGFIIWDGTTANGQLAQRGAYIVLLEYFNAQGDSGVLKETCVLSR
jgi:hypothetical protein